MKQKSNKAVTEKEGTYDIIGYTLNDNSPYKLFVSSINSSNNKKSKPSDEVYLREILDDASYVVGQPEQQQQTTSLGIFKLNTAYATNTIVKTAAQRYVGSAYDGPTVMGKTVTDWTLEQNKNETVADFDFFLVKDSTQIYEYYGNYAKSLLTDHDIPYDSDKIQDWGPNDSSSSPYNIEIGAPWVVNFQFSMSSDPDVDDQGSLDLDYGRWETSVFTGSLGNEVFKAWTGWKSSGTYATMDIREKAHFVDNEGYSVDSSILIDVTYDY